MSADKAVPTENRVFGVKELPDDLGEIGIRPKWNRYEIFVKIKDDDGGSAETVVGLIERHGGVMDDIAIRSDARQKRDDIFTRILTVMERLDYPD